MCSDERAPIALVPDPFTYTPLSYANARADSKPNAVALWTAKIDSYFSLQSTRHVFLTHEELYDEDAITRKLRTLAESNSSYHANTVRWCRRSTLLPHGAHCAGSAVVSR